MQVDDVKSETEAALGQERSSDASGEDEMDVDARGAKMKPVVKSKKRIGLTKTEKKIVRRKMKKSIVFAPNLRQRKKMKQNIRVKR